MKRFAAILYAIAQLAMLPASPAAEPRLEEALARPPEDARPWV